MKILIYVDNNRHGQWSLLKIVSDITKEDLGIEELLNDWARADGEHLPTIDAPASGIYLATFEVDICLPGEEYDDSDVCVTITSAFPTKYIDKYFKKKVR